VYVAIHHFFFLIGRFKKYRHFRNKRQHSRCLREDLALPLTGVSSDVAVLGVGGISGLTSAITGFGHFPSSSSSGITLVETETTSGVTEGLGVEPIFGEFLGDTVDAIVEG